MQERRALLQKPKHTPERCAGGALTYNKATWCAAYLWCDGLVASLYSCVLIMTAWLSKLT
jgi:hypothetical protein